ncbi:MAG: hypothetical protein ACRCV9_04730, partial [Burkholderiaceae bacterium]
MRVWAATFFALLIALLLWAGSSGKLHALFADSSQLAGTPAAHGTQTPPAETIDSLLAKSMDLPGMREAAEQAQPFTMNVCGLDKPLIVDPQAEEPSEAEKALYAETDRVMLALGKTLAHSIDDATQALGLQLISMTEAERSAADAKLFALAAKTKSAYAYRTALFRCRFAAKTADCGALSAKRLTELEPDNADSWLHLADEELAAKRPEAAAAAYARAAHAKRYDLYYAEPLKLAQAALANLRTPLELTVAPQGLVGLATAFPVGQFQQVFRRCDARIVAHDPQRRAECRQLGDLLAQSDTIIGTQAGLSLREQT